jgi:hypothetical protein
MTETLIEGNDLLQADGVTDIPASGECFVAKAHFTAKNREVRISTVWEEFKKRFINKVDDKPAAVSLRKYKLRKISPDGPIIECLGGESKVVTNIASIYSMMKRQAFGQPGALQVNGYANIFYVRDKDGVLCAVRVGWDGEGWNIDAIAAHDPLAWNGQHQVFCPVA